VINIINKQKKNKENFLSLKKIKKNYKKVRKEESEFEYLNSIRPEDSTEEYNPVEYYKDGGLVSRGQGRVLKTKKTKMY
jgi:hypothetical protein